MFAPQTQNEIPSILMNGANTQAKMITDGATNRANMISSAVQNASSSAGNAIGGAVSKWQQNAKLEDANNGMAKTYQAIDEQTKAKNNGVGVLPDGFWDAYYATKKPSERSGMLVGATSVVDSAISQQRQLSYLDAQTKAAANLAVYNASLKTPKEGDTISAEDGFYTRQNGYLIQLTTPDGSIPKPKKAAGLFDQLGALSQQTPGQPVGAAPQGAPQGQSATPPTGGNAPDGTVIRDQKDPSKRWIMKGGSWVAYP